MEEKKAPLTLLRLKPKVTPPAPEAQPLVVPTPPTEPVKELPGPVAPQERGHSDKHAPRSPMFLKLLQKRPAVEREVPHTLHAVPAQTPRFATDTPKAHAVSAKHTPSFFARMRTPLPIAPEPATPHVHVSSYKPTNTIWKRGYVPPPERRTVEQVEPARTQHKPQKKQRSAPQHISRTIEIPESISVTDLALQMAVQVNTVVGRLKKLGAVVNVNSILDTETAALVVEEFGHTHKYTPQFNTEFEELPTPQHQLKPRCPIVTIAGHVDHGKTTILDTIRKTKVAAGEHGGITQSIGAYQVEHNGKQITFIDTPGHLAFSKMREHGIRITDIALLIVAADDSVQEQTIESIRHIQAAKTQMIVVINKIDLPGANPQRVATDLLQYGVVVESMGGDVMSVEISAKTGKNLDQLLDTILVQADMMELDTIHTGPGRGVILEADIVKGLGPCATVLLNRGVLQVGDYFVSGTTHGKVRSMSDSAGNKLKSAHVSQPVRIAGFEDTPDSGSTFGVVKNEQAAQALVEARVGKFSLRHEVDTRTVHDIFAHEATSQNPSFVVNAATQGMLDAITHSVQSISHKHLSAVVVQSKVGPVTAGDVELAKITNSEIIGFQVEATLDAKAALKQYNLPFVNHKIIYKAVEYVVELLRQRALQELLSTVSGHSEVIRVFDVKQVGCVVGCRILSGEIAVKDIVAVHKKGREVYRGTVESIQQDAKQVQVATSGEYGIIIKGDSGTIYKNVAVGNHLMFYKTAPKE